tara:strand:+ start:1099 stop:1812 length:714 start_codon:yes stop_codon:yes gene_type:complete
MSEISTNTFLKLLTNSGISFFLQNIPNNLYEQKSKTNRKLIHNISEILTIKELEMFIKNSNICKLRNEAKSTVVGDGNEKSKIMIIGEAPGAEEDKLGKPFVGTAGQLLNKMLHAISINRKDIYITNIIPWRPPNNRTPTNEEIIQCLSFIQRHIEIINPKLILLLGATASKTILNTNLSITKLRGKWHEYKSINHKETIYCLATYHPAFLLRSPENKKQSWEDLKKFKKRIEDENL